MTSAVFYFSNNYKYKSIKNYYDSINSQTAHCPLKMHHLSTRENSIDYALIISRIFTSSFGPKNRNVARETTHNSTHSQLLAHMHIHIISPPSQTPNN